MAITHYQFCASASRDADISFEDGNTLRVSGIWVDTIASVGTPMQDDNELISIILEWYRMAMAGDPAPRPYKDGPETIFEAFDRTITADTEVDGRQLRQQHGFFYLFREMACYNAGLIAPSELDENMAAMSTRLNNAMRAVQLRALRRRFFVTSSGMFGLGPMDTQVDDVIFVLLGCSVPVVLRQKGQDWTFVGETFVAGIMDGETAHPGAPVERVTIR
jgi:hypothetical protein